VRVLALENLLLARGAAALASLRLLVLQNILIEVVEVVGRINSGSTEDTVKILSVSVHFEAYSLLPRKVVLMVTH